MNTKWRTIRATGCGTENILIVDDEENIVILLKTQLEDLGYTVYTATDSMAALLQIRENPGKFDLLLTDQTMPYMTGCELAQEVLQISPKMPIILNSGLRSMVSENDLLIIGIKKFIQKPISSKVLANTVRQVLDEK